MRTQHNYVAARYCQLEKCDRCDKTYLKDELLEQDGLRVCERCFDETSFEDNRAGGDYE